MYEYQYLRQKIQQKYISLSFSRSKYLVTRVFKSAYTSAERKFVLLLALNRKTHAVINKV